MPGTDTLITDTTGEQIIRYGFNPGMFESLDDSISLIYQQLLPAPDSIAVAQPDSFVYMPSTDRIELIRDVYQGTYLQDWAIGLFLLMFAVLVSIRLTNGKFFGQLIQSSINSTVARRLYGERVYSLLHESFRLDVVFILSSGFFLYHALQTFGIRSGSNDLLFYFFCGSAILIWMTSKLILYRFIGWVFQTQAETDEYLFYHQTGTRVLGLFLMPFSLLLFFTKGLIDELILFLCLFIVLFFSTITLFRGFAIIRKKVFSIFYPILYLCTLEISLMIITGVLLMSVL